MAVLSAPSNIPTLDGTTAVCVSDDATGTVYLSVRTDRAWYSVANGDSQELADADKATIIAQDITAPELVWAGTDEDLATIQLTIDGLAARLDPANPYYVGWVHEEAAGPINLVSQDLTTWRLSEGVINTDNGDGSATISNFIVAFNSMVYEYYDQSASIYGRSFVGSFELKEAAGFEGKLVNISLARVSGGAFIQTQTAVTLTDQWVLHTIPEMVGETDNLGVRIRVSAGTADTLAESFQVRLPILNETT